MKQELFNGNWEEELELQFFSENQFVKEAYICSPLHSDSPSEYLYNLHAARAYMYYANNRMGYQAKAPHAFLPLLLCDKKPEDRRLAIEFGLELLRRCSVVLVCGNRMSCGMKGEIIEAAECRKKILVFDEKLFTEIKEILRESKKNSRVVSLDREHSAMALQAPQLIY